MELSLNRVEHISSKGTIVERKGVELKLIVTNAQTNCTLFNNDELCDGDIWEWSISYGVGNDVY